MEKKSCDVCNSPVDAYVDGKTQQGPWADMCMICHAVIGVGLGKGKGQMYLRDLSGRFQKASG